MKILYLADPNSIHDLKWINYFAEMQSQKAYILPRKTHCRTSINLGSVEILEPISDFSIIRLHYTLITAFRIRSIIRSRDINLIHILYAEPNSLWCLFRKFLQVPMIISCRGTDVLKTIPEAFSKRTLINKLVAPAYKRAFRAADWVTGTSESQLESIRRFSGRTNNLSIIRTGTDVDKLLSDTRRYFPLSTDVDRYILFPRYIKPLYNHEFAIEAIGLLPAEIKRQYKMVFVGKDSGDLEYQNFLISKMSRHPEVNVEFLPKQSQEAIFELYKRANLVVMTPLSDGSPVSAMEAITCKVPVILGPIGYDEEIGRNAVKLNSWDARELADLISQVLDGIIKLNFDHLNLKELSQRENMSRLDSLYQGLTTKRGAKA